MAVSLPGGYAVNPGYIYVAHARKLPHLVKIGRSHDPESRVEKALTWDVSADWTLVQAIPAVDYETAERRAHRCIRGKRLVRQSGEGLTEVFETPLEEALFVTKAVCDEQSKAQAQLAAYHQSQIGAGTEDDLVYWLRNQTYLDDDLVQIRHAVKWASESALNHKELLGRRSIHVVAQDQVALIGRKKGPKLLSTSPFLATWKDALKDTAGFKVNGSVVSVSDLQKMSLATQLVAAKIGITPANP